MLDLKVGNPAGRRVAGSCGGTTHGGRLSARPFMRVREPASPYEDEGSVRIARGAVTVLADAWWSLALIVPVVGGDGPVGDAQLRLERHGPSARPAGTRTRLDLSLPAAELDAIITLLGGVVAQARRDGVLP